MTESYSKNKRDEDGLDGPVEDGPVEDEESKVPIDRGYAWAILAASWLSMMMVNGVYKSLGILFIEIQMKYDSNSSVTSLIVSCLNGTYSFTGLLVQTVALRHFSSRQCMVIGGFLISASFILSSFASNVETVIVLLGCVYGFGTGLVFLPTMTNLSQYFKKYRSVASCIAIMGGSAGGLLFSFLIPQMVEMYTFSGAMLVLGGIELHLVVFGLLMRPKEFYTKTKERSETKSAKCTETIFSENSVENKSLSRVKPLWNKNVLSSQSMQSLTMANSPLLRNKLSSKTASTNGKVAKRHRTISEHSNGSFSIALDRSLIALNKVGFYSGTELSVTSIPEMFTKPTQVNTNDTGSPTCEQAIGMRKRISSCIDCRAIRRIPFILYIPGACCLVTLSALQLFLPPYAKDNGLSVKSSSFLVTIISITDACSSVLWGLFADKNYIRIHKIVSIASAIISIITFLTPLFDSYSAFIAYSVAYGIFGRVFFNLYTPVMVNFLGLECLSSALGIVSLAQTAFIAVFVPVIGIIRDTYSSYVPGLLLTASITMTGSLWILILPLGEKCEKKKRRILERTVELS